MTAAVWIVGGPGDREDLRYSLRSVAENAPTVTEAWVVGDVPEWFAGTRLPTDPLRGKFENQRQSLTRFVNYPGAPVTFYLFNDDMYVTEPVPGQLPTFRNKARASEWNTDHGQHGPECWPCAVKATATWTAARTKTDPCLYECHTPLMFNTSRLRDCINDYPPDLPLTVGQLYPIAGIGGKGIHAGNAKAKAGDSFQHKRNLPMPYLSGNPDSWDGQLGDYIRSSFPNPCRFERAD